ncbi:MAG: dienelactone hydrolase family protein [Gemmatimonadaceae bacterium]
MSDVVEPPGGIGGGASGGDDPHAGQPVRTVGAPLRGARAAVVMVHGRGASAEDILSLAPGLTLATGGVAFLAPQAAGGTWYPFGFMSPIARNEPGISSGVRAIARVLSQVAAAGIPPERTMLLGFSQGACLATEYAARHARRYGGVAGLSGGLIGPDDTPRDYTGSLAGTPVFLGCSDVDGHIPAARVRESAEVLRRLGGEVDMRLYPGMGHLVNEDEVAAVRAMLAGMLAGMLGGD